MDKELISYLEQFITNDRVNTINKVIEMRTRYITVAIENIYQSHNASAVVRTCECIGIQDIHVIENKNRYNINPDVVMGASGWVDIYKYKSSDKSSMEAILSLKKSGYRIVATTLDENACTLNDFNLHAGKCALFFGTELNGISENVIKNTDEFLKIPMFGFTESFNISVSAAIILYQLINRLHHSDIKWELTQEEKSALKLSWLRNSINKCDLIEKYFYEQKENNPNFF